MAVLHETPPREPDGKVRSVYPGCSALDDHYRRTLDDPLPMLDGKTLREAARTRTGRPQVIDWLKELENIEHRRAAQEGHRPYDAAWLWRELGIEVPR